MTKRVKNAFQPVLIVIVLIFLASLISAQTAPEPAPETPTIVSNSNEVSLDLVVRDKKNKPFLDLKPEDIVLTDNGSAVKISSLRLVTSETNVERLVTLVFDQLEPSAARNAHDIADKILKAIPGTNVSFSVLAVDGRLKLFQDFTSDHSALAKAITVVTEKPKTAINDAAEAEKHLIAMAQKGVDPAGTAVSARDREIAQVVLAGLQESQRIVQDQHTQASLAGLLALARTQRQIVGRKIVIYFSQSMQADSNARDMLLSIIGSANRAGVSIYAVDANAVNPQANQGLLATVAIGNIMSAQAQAPPSPLFDAATHASLPQQSAGLTAEVGDRFNRVLTEGISGHSDPLAQLSENTGGAYISAGENMKKPLQRLIDDLNTYYELSYVPPIQEYDGKFRTIAVQPVHTKLIIRSRTGYFALPPTNSAGLIRPFEAPLLKAFDQTQLPSALNFRSSVLRLGELPDGNANELVVELPISEVELKEDNNTNLFSLHAAIVAQVKNKAGTVIEHFSEDIPRHGAMETMSDARTQVITMQRHFIAPPGEYILETAVMDRSNGKLAAQRADFTIPPQNDGASLSDLALVRRTDPFTWEADPLEPLRYQNGKIVPNLSGSVSSDSKEVSFFLMVHPDSTVLAPAKLEMEVSRNGESLARMPLPLRAVSGQGAVPYLASIQSKSLKPGNYEITTIITQGESTSQRSITLRVPGPELASTSTQSVGSPDNPNDAERPDTKLQTAALQPLNAHPFVITSLPTSTIAAPAPEKLASLISNTRERATGYAKSLPNFVCIQVTDRSADPSGQGKWKHKDTFAELLRFRDHTETRTTLEVNGHASSTHRDDMNGALSRGEFGGLLDAVFQPSANAEFTWKESATLGSSTVEVLNYRVEEKNSSLGLSTSTGQFSPGFHGSVYVDSATNGIRRVTLEADNLPFKFSIKAASIIVDYDYMAIGTHDYLMPIHAVTSLKQGKKSESNEMVFRDYRRYGSKIKITSTGSDKH